MEILVVAHKPYVRIEESGYIPYWVGEFRYDYAKPGEYIDGMGMNIADKNNSFCELTAQYYLYKNSHSDIMGIVHYRRYFVQKKKVLLDEATIRKTLNQVDIIVPNKRRYYIETLEQHYIHSHQEEGLQELRHVIQEVFPNYLSSFEKVMKQRSAYMFNMFIAKEEQFQAYSQWLFDVLFTLEKRLDISNYSKEEQRVFGYLSELLLNVWLDYHQWTVATYPVWFTEGDPIIRKGCKMIIRKVKSQWTNFKISK